VLRDPARRVPRPQTRGQQAPGTRSPRRRRLQLRRLFRRVLGVVAVLVLVATVASAGYDRLTDTPSAVPPLDAHGHLVQTGDVRTHYESWGSAGSAVVLVPGFAESAYVFQRLGPELAAAHHRVFALDVRGYGYTERRGPYTLAADAQQLADFLRVLHLRRADGVSTVLVGHSSGAAVVGDVALTHPADVAGIVFLDGDGTPYGVGPAWVHALVRDPFATTLVRLASRHPALAARVYGDACGPRCPVFTGAVADAWTRPFRVAGAAAAMRQILGRQLIGLEPDQLTRIRVPAAVVYGSADPETPPALAAETARRLHAPPPTAITGARHLVMVSHPRELAAALVATGLLH